MVHRLGKAVIFCAASSGSPDGRQPADERGSGATTMPKDGLFEKFGKPDYAVALHCGATVASGKFALLPGYAMANVDRVDVTRLRKNPGNRRRLYGQRRFESDEEISGC